MSRPTRGLSRGLASLIPDDALVGEPLERASRDLRQVPIDEVVPNPNQPRTAFAADELAALSRSIQAHGVISPLIVRREEGRYVLIAGERRLRAAALAGLSEVPVLVRDATPPDQQLEIALVENLQRADLDPIEAARGFQRLIDVFALTQEQVAARVGRERATVANAVRLLKLPDFVLEAIRAGQISAGHGRALLPITAVDALRRTLAKVVSQELSVRATEQLAAEWARNKPAPSAAERSRDQRFDYATRLLQDVLHTSVQIQPKRNGSGRIVIDYADAEHLEALIAHLTDGDDRPLPVIDDPQDP